jgi:two-component system, response regulator, stage 0 sporulation protein F
MPNKKILIVDDYDGIRRSLSMALGDQGYIVSSAEDGQKAWDLIQKDQPDLLITDWEMPILNGSGLIKKLNEGKYTFPIIVNSGAVKEIDKYPIKYGGRLVLRDKTSPLKELYSKMEYLLR